jgi:hypothetical protein
MYQDCVHVLAPFGLLEHPVELDPLLLALKRTADLLKLADGGYALSLGVVADLA